MKTLPFVEFIRLIIAEDVKQVAARLREELNLAAAASPVGASRQSAKEYFFGEISHYLYAGDTPLHMAAAAAGSLAIVKLLVRNGADPRARNRRGAQPIHYAADGRESDPRASRGRADVIAYLLSIGAEPDATDKAGVTPLCRAVRTRSLAAVRALLDGGANPRKANKAGSTPLHLAVQTTGASNSGSEAARAQQAEIIKLLLDRGAKPTDRDARGKRVDQAARSEWVRELLKTA